MSKQKKYFSTNNVCDELKKEELNVIENLKDFWMKHGEDVLKKYEMVTEWPADFENRDISAPLAFFNKFKKCSVLVLTANQIEANMMVRLLSGNGTQKLDTLTADDSIYRIGELNGIGIVHLQPQDMASFTRKGSHRAVEAALKRFKPKLVVSLGVAFGADPESQNLGDVIVSKEIFAYDAKNKRTNGEIKLDIKSIYEMDSTLMCSWMNPLSQRKFPDCENWEYNWHWGMILSGGTVLSDADEKKRLFHAANLTGHNIIGGEMEGCGIYLAREGENIPWVVIKGICDWAVLKNGWHYVLNDKSQYAELVESDIIKDRIQAMAMDHAFQALQYLLLYNKRMLETNNHELNCFSGNILRNIFITVWRFLLQKINIVLLLEYIISFILVFDLYTKMNAKDWSQYGTMLISVILYLLMILCCSFLTWTFVMRSNKLISETPYIQILGLDFDRCSGCFKNSDRHPLLNFKVAWLNKWTHLPISVFSCEKISAHEQFVVGIHQITMLSEIKNIPLSRSIPLPSKPAAIQFEYEFNEQRFCHVITSRPSMHRGKPTYYEYIFKEMDNYYLRLCARKWKMGRSDLSNDE